MSDHCITIKTKKDWNRIRDDLLDAMGESSKKGAQYSAFVHADDGTVIQFAFHLPCTGKRTRRRRKPK